MDAAIARNARPYKGIPMEGMLATWYARNTAKSLAEFHYCAKRIAAGLAPGGRVLEIAPGPGYLAIELARLGPYRITGVDISRSFVRIAAGNAAGDPCHARAIAKHKLILPTVIAGCVLKCHLCSELSLLPSCEWRRCTAARNRFKSGP